jgi:hypothetical protein
LLLRVGKTKQSVIIKYNLNRSEELHGVKEHRKLLRRKANWIAKEENRCRQTQLVLIINIYI